MKQKQKHQRQPNPEPQGELDDKVMVVYRAHQTRRLNKIQIQIIDIFKENNLDYVETVFLMEFITHMAHQAWLNAEKQREMGCKVLEMKSMYR
jgi:hypothetical protein